MSRDDSWPEFLRMLFVACAIAVGYHCVVEVTTLHGRVSRLEKASASSSEYPDINLTITIPDDWVK
jgi:hypothetical protein